MDPGSLGDAFLLVVRSEGGESQHPGCLVEGWRGLGLCLFLTQEIRTLLETLRQYWEAQSLEKEKSEMAREWGLRGGAVCHLSVVSESVNSATRAAFHRVYVHLLLSLRAPQGKYLPLFPTESAVLSLVLVIKGMLVNK